MGCKLNPNLVYGLFRPHPPQALTDKVMEGARAQPGERPVMDSPSRLGIAEVGDATPTRHGTTQVALWPGLCMVGDAGFNSLTRCSKL